MNVAGWDEVMAEAQRETHVVIAGKRMARVPHVGHGPCRDCAAEPGQLHVPACCVERCPACGQQAGWCGCEEASDYGVQ